MGRSFRNTFIVSSLIQEIHEWYWDRVSFFKPSPSLLHTFSSSSYQFHSFDAGLDKKQGGLWPFSDVLCPYTTGLWTHRVGEVLRRKIFLIFPLLTSSDWAEFFLCMPTPFLWSPTLLGKGQQWRVHMTQMCNTVPEPRSHLSTGENQGRWVISQFLVCNSNLHRQA